MAGGKRPVELTVDAKDFKRALLMAKEFQPKLATNLRRHLKVLGSKASGQVKMNVLNAPSKGHPVSEKHPLLRRGIAGGVSTKVTNTQTMAGVYIQSKGSDRLSRGLHRVFDSPNGWQHPVFARRDSGRVGTTSLRKGFSNRRDGKSWSDTGRKMVHQKGHPFFQKYLESQQPELEKAVKDALEKTVAQVESGAKLGRGKTLF